jgi:GNAT superfamily N-acetyltransferase
MGDTYCVPGEVNPLKDLVMIRIRKIINPYLDVNIRQIEKVKEIVRKQFPGISEKKVDGLIHQLADPVKYKYQSMLFVAEDAKDSVRGFALLIYMADLQFCYLDYLAVSPEKASSGVGGALYQRVREEAESYGSIGIFFECLPDDPELCQDKEIIAQNRKRLAF